IRHGVMAASRGGKVKTGLQILAIGWYLWPMPEALVPVGPWLMAAAVVVTVATGLDYTARALRLRRPTAGPAGGGETVGAGEAVTDQMAETVVRRLAQRQQTLAVAESLTGGLLAAALVDVPGASAVFRGGLVVYATDLKSSLTGVSPTLLAERGPVDPAVAGAMAEGVRDRCAADWGVATTGVAGPTPQGGVPVG